MHTVTNINKLSAVGKEIYREMMMEVDTDIRIDKVILSDENKAKIGDFLKEIENRDKLLEYGLRPMNRILMYGASGTGKTMLSKALSNHLGYTMLYVDVAKSLTEGNVSMNISKMFQLSNELGECVLFLDECDSIAWSRDSTTAERGDVRRATNSLFQNLDQMNETNVFIAATNMLHRLDPAFERRFNMKMEFRRPTINLKESIAKFIYPKFRIVDDVDKTVEGIVERRAQQNAKLSYYEIQGIVEKAMKRSIINGTNVVKTSDVYNDFRESMGFKIRFNTGDDDEEIFRNNEHY